MSAKQINHNFDLVSYVGGLVQLRKSGAYYIGACPVCGGKDRFQIKRADWDMWICRKCTPDKYHSAIDFFIAFHQIPFKEAYQRMGGELEPRRQLGRPQPIADPAPVQIAPDADWQAQAWREIDEACTRLTGGEDGAPGRRYLTQRAISRGAMYMNSLGYGEAYGRPAIVIPYLDAGEIITAVKYRFIDEIAQTDKGRRFAMRKESKPFLFGLQHVLPSDRVLLFVEGEMNQISILQTLPRDISVVSAGSDSSGNAALLRALASHYNQIVIWTDEPSKAEDVRERMQCPAARILKSPLLHGKKWDANEMLQAGLLAGFLERTMRATCDGVPVATQLEQVTA